MTCDKKHRADSLNRIADEVNACHLCPLWENATQSVPGEGDACASIMLIGEGPGEQEDISGHPFIGRAGKVLDSLLREAGLSRDEIFIGNIVKHRPPANRDPGPDEIMACTPWLTQQINVVRPGIIVPMGRHATRFVLDRMDIKFKKITEISGIIFKGEPFGFPVLVYPVLHPAAALHNPLTRQLLMENFRKLGELHPGNET